MMTEPVFVAKLELCSNFVGITSYPKWLVTPTCVFFVVREIVEIHATRMNLSQGGVKP
jgi:hypothetical protein